VSLWSQPDDMKESIHLLIVEDNPGDVLLVREALRHCSMPVDVIIASDGEQALRLLNQGLELDLIILDLNIPKIDGYMVLERMGHRSPPVVVFTSGTEGAVRALALGAREVVQKPIDFTTFIEAVCHIVETWGTAGISNR